jgi:hypothetical protein
MRLSPKRNTPSSAPPTAPPVTLLASTAPTPHLSSTILRKESRSATEKEIFDLEPGEIDAVRASSLGELFRPGNLVNHARGHS